MKRNLLTLGLLAASFSLNAQYLSYVGKEGNVSIKEGAIYYNGGGINVSQSGSVDVNGDIMVVGSSTDKLSTSGQNHFILRLNNPTSYTDSKYGQLYIKGLVQNNIDGIVDKEYKADKHGSMQQMGIPFYNKTLASLATELGFSGFSNLRDTNAVGYWDNQAVVMHNLASTAKTSDKASKDTNAILYNNAARYYAVGTKNWDPSTKVYTISGIPFSDVANGGQLSYTLRNAGYKTDGSAIAFGVGTGKNLNTYDETYNSYLQDDFDESSNGYFNETKTNENGTFGRNIYQFANPFLTNIDITHIGYTEEAKDNLDDKNAITSIQGIRFEATGITENQEVNGHKIGGTSASSFKYVTFSETYKSGKRVPVGDTDLAVIKPLQTFAIKLSNNNANQTLIFNTLRRLAYTTRTESKETNADVASKKITSSIPNSTVKQLRVIGLDENGVEVMRTYYAVSNEMITGISDKTKAQVITFDDDLSTREEYVSYDGKEDDTYRLYINEANEINYKGKPIELLANTSKIKTFKFQLAENAQAFVDGKSAFVDGGDSFYIEQDGNLTKIGHNNKVPALNTISKLYYGRPTNNVLNTDNNFVNTKFDVVHNSLSNNYKVIFPQTWKTANVEIYDLSGRLISKTPKTSTNKDLYITLEKHTTYIVVGISENGDKVSKKVIGQ